jgi:RNA-directed DNA polymerase
MPRLNEDTGVTHRDEGPNGGRVEWPAECKDRRQEGNMKTMQMQMDLDDEAPGRAGRTHDGFIAARLAKSPTGEDRLMETILGRQNMLDALKRVESNKGAPGVDGMKTGQLRGYILRHWEKIKRALLDGTYQPMPARRKEIPKEGGGIRLLGIPTVLDRLIQQAIAQVLTSLWDHTFSEYSYGFRPNRSAHMAIEQARQYVEAGYTYVVDLDLSKFFDRVHHDRLMSRLATRITDKRVLKLIRAYLNSGTLVGAVIEQAKAGTPQGGPLSPLLANIVLDELDKELERRKLRFVRYADDVAIYVRTPKAAERVKRSVSRVITGRLKLVINEEKSEVSRPWHSKYLGFRITRYMGKTRTGIHAKSIARFRRRVREMTARDRGRSLEALVGELNCLLRGWAGYFRPGLGATLAGELDHWIRRRLRAYVWTQWKLPRTRIRNLMARGIARHWAVMVGNTRKGAWHMSKNGTVCAALLDDWFTRSVGLVLLTCH